MDGTWLCRFPESEGSSQFWDNLLNKIDCVTKDERRWPPGLHDIPARFGKLVDIESFDASFFSVHGRQAQVGTPGPQLKSETRRVPGDLCRTG